MSDGRIIRYVVSGHRSVSGWFSRVDAELFSTLMLTQIHLGVRGDAMETGVHHGRSFIAISLGLGEGEKAIAIDIFEQQHLNIGHSGNGNLEIFEQNLRRYGEYSKTKIISASSLDVTADEIKGISSGLRFVSIDGGHWYDAVMNDLTLAASCAGSECIIALDDFSNPDFPDVSAAYFAWIGSNRDFIPLCISQGKLYIYRGSRADSYYSSLSDNKYLKFNYKKNVTFLGNEIPVYTGNYGGIRGFIAKYTSIYTPSFHSYIRARIQAMSKSVIQ
jgi:hypothetical protein